MQIQNKLISINEAKALIESGKTLAISGDEACLVKLPQGNWIGGTIPYFMGEQGGVFDTEMVFVTDLTPIRNDFTVKLYTTETIQQFPEDRFSNGFTYMIVPGLSEIHSQFAMITHSIGSIMEQPVFGWISGIDLADLGKVTPKVVDGTTGDFSDTQAVALFIELEANKTASLDIINIFEPDISSPTIEFEEEGFSAIDCLIGGTKQNLMEYVQTNNVDTKLPLVADYSGVPINISFQGFDESNSQTNFYAPVQKGVKYHIAKSIGNYMQKFATELEAVNDGTVALSCNCILNYLYAELENKKTGELLGPITFGEIAYMLVNQTLVYLRID